MFYSTINHKQTSMVEKPIIMIMVFQCFISLPSIKLGMLLAHGMSKVKEFGTQNTHQGPDVDKTNQWEG